MEQCLLFDRGNEERRDITRTLTIPALIPKETGGLMVLQDGEQRILALHGGDVFAANTGADYYALLCIGLIGLIAQRRKI